jgi:hypothetical protein
MNSKYPNRGAPWTEDLIKLLITNYLNGATIEELCNIFGRTEGGIISRLEQLGLYEYFSKSSPERTFYNRREAITNVIDNSIETTRELLNKLITSLTHIGSKSNEYINLNETARQIDPYVLDLEKMLSLCIKDMVNNGWYKNQWEATFFLRDRIKKGEV